MKNYRLLGAEIEIIGRRLDSARTALARSKRAWAKNYWQQTIERLVFQWKALPILHDGDVQNTAIPRWTIDYDFYEKGPANEGPGIADHYFDILFRRDSELNISWERNREVRLAKAQ